MRTLLERRLVAVRGRAKTVGHPLLYVTTDFFLEHFGIEDLAELPKLEEFEALVDRDQARAELREAGVLPVETQAGPDSDAQATGESAPVAAGPPETEVGPAPEETTGSSREEPGPNHGSCGPQTATQ